jgi:hypothetical protein
MQVWSLPVALWRLQALAGAFEERLPFTVPPPPRPALGPSQSQSKDFPGQGGSASVTAAPGIRASAQTSGNASIDTPRAGDGTVLISGPRQPAPGEGPSVMSMLPGSSKWQCKPEKATYPICPAGKAGLCTPISCADVVSSCGGGSNSAGPHCRPQPAGRQAQAAHAICHPGEGPRVHTPASPPLPPRRSRWAAALTLSSARPTGRIAPSPSTAATCAAARRSPACASRSRSSTGTRTARATAALSRPETTMSRRASRESPGSKHRQYYG